MTRIRTALVIGGGIAGPSSRWPCAEPGSSLLGFGARVNDTGLTSTRGTMYLIFGKRAFFGYQVFDDSSGGWFVNLPRHRPMTLAQARAVGAEEWMRVRGEAFAGDRTPALDLLRRADPADLLVTGPLEAIPTVPTWSTGRMVLIGDAAHATSPSSGQGASLPGPRRADHRDGRSHQQRQGDPPRSDSEP